MSRLADHIARTRRTVAPACRAAAAWTTLLIALATPAAARDIGPERCAANRAAGPVTFLTSFAYGASSGILDVIAAKALGFFDALCLDVTIRPGANNAQIVSAGTAQLAGLGGASDVMEAVDNGAEIVAVATYGNTSAIELLTMADSGVKSLRQLSGAVVGYKGAIPPQIQAMLAHEGVDAGAIQWVSVGYDPRVLTNGGVRGLTAYKTNEALTLQALGFNATAWDPQAYGIRSTFNTQIANAAWARAHPGAVEDFLRASLHAYAWIGQSGANLDQALGYAAELSTAGYDVAQSRARWIAEAQLIADSQPPGTPLGWQSDAQWRPEADTLTRFRLVRRAPDLTTAFDGRYVAAIHRDGGLIWPAP